MITVNVANISLLCSAIYDNFFGVHCEVKWAYTYSTYPSGVFGAEWIWTALTAVRARVAGIVGLTGLRGEVGQRLWGFL